MGALLEDLCLVADQELKQMNLCYGPCGLYQELPGPLSEPNVYLGPKNNLFVCFIRRAPWNSPGSQIQPEWGMSIYSLDPRTISKGLMSLLAFYRADVSLAEQQWEQPSWQKQLQDGAEGGPAGIFVGRQGLGWDVQVS